jgi:hypothetical protein
MREIRVVSAPPGRGAEHRLTIVTAVAGGLLAAAVAFGAVQLAVQTALPVMIGLSHGFPMSAHGQPHGGPVAAWTAGNDQPG